MKPSPQQMRAMGYAADAEPVKLSRRAFVAFCAWVNIDPEKIPGMTRFKPAETAAAWERVAAAFKPDDLHSQPEAWDE